MSATGRGMIPSFSVSHVRQEEIRELISSDARDQKIDYVPSERLIDRISDVCAEAAEEHYHPILDDYDEEIALLDGQLDEAEDGGDFTVAVRDLLEALGYSAFRDENLTLRVQEVVWRLRSARKTA